MQVSDVKARCIHWSSKFLIQYLMSNGKSVVSIKYY